MSERLSSNPKTATDAGKELAKAARLGYKRITFAVVDDAENGSRFRIVVAQRNAVPKRSEVEPWM